MFDDSRVVEKLAGVAGQLASVGGEAVSFLPPQCGDEQGRSGAGSELDQYGRSQGVRGGQEPLQVI
ncbi:hypothetical protein [Fodinicola feengrottensis]|uniref:hypothetical protein n=1 Tax=Fodinicola feengrottensis TaxID=435914 RepID=UPI0013D5D04B|nr:hypothetical protein [Fodinicola feengrottensis]